MVYGNARLVRKASANGSIDSSSSLMLGDASGPWTFFPHDQGPL
jgi:hypothetical protein